MAITQVTIDTAQAIIGTWAGYASMALPGVILAGVQTAAIVASTQRFKLMHIKNAGKNKHNKKTRYARYARLPQPIKAEVILLQFHQLTI